MKSPYFELADTDPGKKASRKLKSEQFIIFINYL